MIHKKLSTEKNEARRTGLEFRKDVQIKEIIQRLGNLLVTFAMKTRDPANV